jgi:CelD/BcsL family acetyltransferase involved in cellulose biosynthesis/glycosyltransferase involved in cell wall biosynthesis
MPLTVLSVSYPLARVGRDAIGGAEQVLSAIDEALCAAGHRSIVVAAEGSSCRGELVPIPQPEGVLDAMACARTHSVVRRSIERVIASTHVDVVHLHGVDFHHYVPRLGPPVLVTLHMPPEMYEPSAVRTEGVLLHCVSASQRRRFPNDLALLPEIENGIRVSEFRPAWRKRPFALALGRICPEKAFHLALEAAHLADVALVLAGEVFAYPEHVRHFERQIRPQLDARRKFVGPIGGARKRRLLGGARCVVVPSVVHETSSLVAMEALASGTPIVAFRNGALPEMIEHGRTGFLASDFPGLVEGLRRARELSPADCRKVAEERFSCDRMVANYLERYRELAGSAPRSRIRAEPVPDPAPLRDEWTALWDRCPSATPFQRPEWLLPWCRCFGVVPWTVAVRRGGRLLALALAQVVDEGRERVLRLCGEGVTDWLEPLVDPAEGAAAARELLAAYAESGAVSRLELSQLRPQSPLAAAVSNGEVREGESCPALALPRAIDDLAAAVGKRQLAYFRYCFRRAERSAHVEVTRADQTNLDELLDALFALHAARWREKEQPGVLASPAVRRFHREAARGLLAAGILRLCALRFDGRIAAVFYGFAAHGRTHYYLSGFDPAFERLSPGTMIVGVAIEDAVREGCTEFDFLRGREPYKYAWGARDRASWVLRAAAFRRAEAGRP